MEREITFIFDAFVHRSADVAVIIACLHETRLHLIAWAFLLRIRTKVKRKR
jgi:hypothetical protein